MERNVAERFWGKADRSGGADACWPWVAGRQEHRGGYGKFRDGDRHLRAHRFAYELVNGPIPIGLVVCHSCDNPPCVNPAHLWVGTTADNQRDKKEKGRSASGDAHGSRTHPESVLRGDGHPRRANPDRYAHLVGAQAGSPLHEDDVRAIRERYSSGETQQRIAADFGVSQHTISRIVRKLAWAGV